VSRGVGFTPDIALAPSLVAAFIKVMSFADILAVLPKLSREERETIVGRIADLDEGLWIDKSVSPEERREIDWRLAEAGAGQVTWNEWGAARARIEGKLPRSS